MGAAQQSRAEQSRAKLGIIWRSNLLSSSACAANKLPLPCLVLEAQDASQGRLRHGPRHGARLAIVQDHHEMGLNRTKMFVSVNEKAKSAASAGQACSLHVA